MTIERTTGVIEVEDVRGKTYKYAGYYLKYAIDEEGVTTIDLDNGDRAYFISSNVIRICVNGAARAL